MGSESVPDVHCEQGTSSSSRNGSEILADSATVRVVRTLPELEALKTTWNTWCDDPSADLDYYLASARCRSDFVRPHVMVVDRDGRPDCMLVGRLEHRCVKLKVGHTSLFEPKVRQLFFLQGGFFGNCSVENSRLLVQEIKRCLQRGEADGAEIARLTKDSSLRQPAESEFGFLCRGHFVPVHEHRWLELPGNFKEFLQGLSRKNRHELRRHEKKLKEDFSGRTHIHCYRHEDEVNELAQEVEKISAKTYQRALGVGFRPDVEILESLRSTAHQGGLRGCILYLDEQPCAFFIGKHYKQTFHGHYMGFDPQFGKYSPGLLVLMHSIEECFDPHMRATQFDLGWGDRQYKRLICNQSRLDGPLYLYAPSWGGLKLNLLRSTTSLLDLMARKLVARNSFLQKLKNDRKSRLQKASASDSSGNASTDSSSSLSGRGDPIGVSSRSPML